MVLLPSPSPEELLLHDKMCRAGLKRIHQGKVRDTFTLPDPNYLLLYTTNRLSIFDFVLNCFVPDKGAILNALCVNWSRGALGDVSDDLVACGRGIDDFLDPSLHGNTVLQTQAVVVKKLSMIPVECIVRGYLTGSAWAEYQKDQSAYGYALPAGLHDGSRLPEPIFTPTTKSPDGHDESIPVKEVTDRYGMWIADESLRIFNIAADRCDRQGFIVADTKLEFGDNRILGDEWITPDSSRFWRKVEWEEANAQRTAPASYDKEVVRQWGKKVVTPFGVTGLNKLDPKKAEHLDFVHSLEVPTEVLKIYSEKTHCLFAALAGLSLAYYHQHVFGLAS
jgi:phosphoribosylaminoimidazole-succinocarboxamide synthase